MSIPKSIPIVEEFPGVYGDGPEQRSTPAPVDVREYAGIYADIWPGATAEEVCQWARRDRFEHGAQPDEEE